MISLFRRDKRMPVRIRVRIAAWLFSLALITFFFLLYGEREAFSLPVMGEAAGVIALVFIVLSLILMLRLPVIANFSGGLEAMYSLHRGFGITGYGFALLHPLLLSWEAGWDVMTMQGKDFGFRSGWTGVLIFMVVLFCTFILKTRGYSIWRRLHTMAMAAFVVMAWHVISYQGDLPLVGKIGLDALLVLGLVVPVLRTFLVDRGWFSKAFVVESVGHPVKDVIDMQLRPRGGVFPIKSGQFVFARFNSGEGYQGCGHFHPFTASSVAKEGGLRLSIKSSGMCTQAMQSIKPGLSVDLQGPFGELFQHVRRDTEVWIAGGIGITPFLARMRELDDAHVPVQLFYFFDSLKNAPYLSEFQSIAPTKSVLTFYPIMTRGDRNMMPSVFDATLPPWNDKHYVLCGSDGFTNAIRDYLAAHGVKPASILQERFEFR